ncbi:MAG: histidine phosphatase family protein [Nitrososphaeraceae archaeon]|nr:histidine phosphatase family protein [Nitrososphaeraceae archaeon]
MKDTKRQLTISGKKEVVEIAKSLKKLGVNFNVIISSPLARAFQTAKIIAKEYKLIEQIEQSEELKPNGSKDFLYNKLSKSNIDSVILIVGHEPYLSSMINDIISNNADTDRNYNTNHNNIVLKKAGLSRIKITSTVPKLKGELRWLLTPRILKKI